MKDPIFPTDGVSQKFQDHALVSAEFLSRDIFKKHYIPELFTPVKAVKQFRRLFILADYSTTEYIMPALLQIINDDQLSCFRVSMDSVVPPLVLKFPLGIPRLGIFCSLTSPDNHFPSSWEI